MKDRKHTPFGTVLLDEEGERVIKVLTRCPSCGMVDFQFMNQGARSSHFRNYQVGAVSKYHCGKCREYFQTLQIQVPPERDALDLFEEILKLYETKHAPRGMTAEWDA